MKRNLEVTSFSAKNCQKPKNLFRREKEKRKSWLYLNGVSFLHNPLIFLQQTPFKKITYTHMYFWRWVPSKYFLGVTEDYFSCLTWCCYFLRSLNEQLADRELTYKWHKLYPCMAHSEALPPSSYILWMPGFVLAGDKAMYFSGAVRASKGDSLWQGGTLTQMYAEVR